MIEVHGLRKSYGAKDVVRGIDFEVSTGEIFGILGPNGAGKTTTVECIGGLRQRDAGEIRVAGFDPANEARELREALGIQLQESRLPDKQTVGEAMRLYSSFYDSPRDWRELIERLGLGSKESTYFAKLSGGQKQRLSVELALIGNPKVAILDELTTGLDPGARREVWGLLEDLKDTGVTFLLVSHFMEEAQRLCDRVAVINDGRIAALGTPTELATAVDADQRMSFVSSHPVNLATLTSLPDVHRAEQIGDRIQVTGTDNVATTVIIALHEQGITAQKLRVDQPNLDDAFVALTDGAVASADGAHQHATTTSNRATEGTRP